MIENIFKKIYLPCAFLKNIKSCRRNLDIPLFLRKAMDYFGKARGLLIASVFMISFPFFDVYAKETSILNPLKATTFTELINDIAGWIFMIAIPLATLMFLIGGFMFMVSGGNEQKVAQAKRLMIWSAVGLAVCLVGSGFTSIIKQLLGAN